MVDAGKSQTGDDLPQLRREFVSMLFALAAAQVAVVAYSVWTADPPAAGSRFWACGAGIAHLVLALVVIATSWIGWSKSKSAARGVSGVFDRDFPALLVDVLLVIFYFFLASSAEVGPGPSGRDVLQTPSPWPEIQWTTVLLVLYGVWDALTKWFPRGTPPPTGWLRNAIAYTVASTASVFVVLGMAAFVNWRVPAIDGIDTVLLDLGLVAIVVFFRTMKSAEVEWFEKKLAWRSPTGVSVELKWKSKAFALVLIAMICCAIPYFRH